MIEATIEGVGTIRMPAVAGEAPAEKLSGAQLPPISTYQQNREN